MAQQHQNSLHFSVFGEPVDVVTSDGKRTRTTGIIEVTEQLENSAKGTGVIVRARLAIPSFIDPSRMNNDLYQDSPQEVFQIRSTWRLEFRGQSFAIESMSPPVSGFIKLNVIALKRELSHSTGLDAR